MRSFQRRPAIVSRSNPFVLALRDAVSRSVEGEALSIGRDGASDAISFLEAGIPAVEFGPVGGGHHGPEEWVSISLAGALPPGARRLRARPARRTWRGRLRRRPPLRAVDGGASSASADGRPGGSGGAPRYP